MTKAVNILVKGKVQGVFYRKTTKQKADELNLKGWVQNLDDGGVEIHAEGEGKDLNDLIKWCHLGPKNAVVTEVSVNQATYSKATSFTIIR